MGIAYPGSKDWYNSAERSAKLRKARQAYEEKMKGTFSQKEKSKRKDYELTGKQDRLTQELRNKGTAATQTIATAGAGKRQDSINAFNREKLVAGQVLTDARANRWNAGARAKNYEADALGITLPYADRVARKGAGLNPDKGQTFSKVGGSIPALPGNTIPAQPYSPNPVDVNQNLLDKIDEQNNIISGLESFGVNSKKKKSRNLLDDLGYADSEFN